jgi:hypothetical protein
VADIVPTKAKEAYLMRKREKDWWVSVSTPRDENVWKDLVTQEVPTED